MHQNTVMSTPCQSSLYFLRLGSLPLGDLKLTVVDKQKLLDTQLAYSNRRAMGRRHGRGNDIPYPKSNECLLSHHGPAERPPHRIIYKPTKL